MTRCIGTQATPLFLKQGNANFLLKPFDLHADSRLTSSDTICRELNAATIDNGDKTPQQNQVNGIIHSSIFLDLNINYIRLIDLKTSL
jgi:hypothetical protein